MRKIGIVGLGYVGLPLAVEFGGKRPVVAFDINRQRVEQLQQGFDKNNEVTSGEFNVAKHVLFTADTDDLRECDFYIVAVPTPISSDNKPDLSHLDLSCRIIAPLLKKEDIVVFESTVFPGATEEVCVPLLESESGLKFNHDFFCGYSPERINPGDRLHRLSDIVKLTSGSTPQAADIVDSVYEEIIEAGTYKTSSIRVAEAAKVIENTQRDLNIAFANELALICEKLDINTNEVLDAAATKWNFMPFRPGLVGGHCIGVDPFYLTHKAMEVGYEPEIILAGRRINDGMSRHVVRRVCAGMEKKGINVSGSRCLVLGITFKENCPDVRNTKVIEMVNGLAEQGCNVDIYDPLADRDEILDYFGLELLSDTPNARYDAIIMAVAHDTFRHMPVEDVRALGKIPSMVFDVKGIFPAECVDDAL